MPAAVYFDLDGTLFDTRADLAATVNHTRADLGLPEISQDAVIANVGQGARFLMANSIPESDRSFEELWSIFSGHYIEHCSDQLLPYPGVEQTLEELKRRGWQLGINTNKPNFAVKAIAAKFPWVDDYFGKAVVAGGDCDEMKPSAMPLLKCAEKLGRKISSDDWMVGDSWNDMQCAQNAGVNGAFCTFGFGSLADSAYTAKIDSFPQLLDLTNN